ncbi:sec-independent protein translocase protein TatB [Oxalobacteraceae bacterium GrIS 2.11]
MIDLGLAKLAMIGAVALIVIGPEKLPKVARMAGSLLGRAQRYLNDVKAEVSREIELDELRKVQKDMQEAASDLKTSVAAEMAEVETNVNSIWQNPAHIVPESATITRKAKEFRRKKLVRNSALPAWYKQQQGSKSRLLSASARVARYRSKPTTTQSFF